MALWFFQRTAPGNIRRIPLPSMQRFLAGERALAHDGDGYVRCIGMAVELRNRKPSAVRRVWFSKTGIATGQWWMPRTASPSGGWPTSPSGVRRSPTCRRCGAR